MSAPDAELIDETYEDGAHLRLLRRDGQLEVWRGETLLFGQARRREDRAFAEFAMAPVSGRDDLTVTLAGLGTGLLLRALLDIPGVREIEVIERSSAIVRWCKTHFAIANGGAASDPRVTLREAELGAILNSDAPHDRFALVLDLDASTERVSEAENAAFYDEAGLRRLEGTLRSGGVLALASTRREPQILRTLTTSMQNVAEVAAPVDSEPGSLDYFYRARKPASTRGRN